jgi:hypothetical protein
VATVKSTRRGSEGTSARVLPATITATIALPRDAVVVRAEPDFISQRNCEPLLGLSPRSFLDMLPTLRANGVRVIHLGKARLVPRAELVAFLVSTAPAPAVDALPAGGEPDEIDTILARAGTVRR